MRRQMMLGRVLLQHMIAEMQVDLDRHREGQEGILTDDERAVRMQEIRDLARQLEEIGMILNILMITTSPTNSATGPVNSAGETVIIHPQRAPVSVQGILSSDVDVFSDNESDSEEGVRTYEDERVLSSNVRLDSARLNRQSSSTSEFQDSSPQTTPRQSVFFFSDRTRTPQLLGRTSNVVTTTSVTTSTQTSTIGADVTTAVHNSRLLSRPSQEQNLVSIDTTHSDSAVNEGASYNNIISPPLIGNSTRQPISPFRSNTPVHHSNGSSLPTIPRQYAHVSEGPQPTSEHARDQPLNQYIWIGNQNRSSITNNTNHTESRQNSINTNTNQMEHYGGARSGTMNVSANSRSDSILLRDGALSGASQPLLSDNIHNLGNDHGTVMPAREEPHVDQSIRSERGIQGHRRTSNFVGMSSNQTGSATANRRDSSVEHSVVARPEFWSQRSSVVIEEYMSSEEHLTNHTNTFASAETPSRATSRRNSQAARRPPPNRSSGRSTSLPLTSGQLIRSRTFRGKTSKTPKKK